MVQRQEPEAWVSRIMSHIILVTSPRMREGWRTSILRGPSASPLRGNGHRSSLTSCKYDYIYMWLPYWNEAHGSPPNSYGKIIVVKVYMSVYPRKTFIQAVGFGDYASWGHQGEIPLRCLDALSAKYPSTTTGIRYNLGVLSAIQELEWWLSCHGHSLARTSPLRRSGESSFSHLRYICLASVNLFTGRQAITNHDSEVLLYFAYDLLWVYDGGLLGLWQIAWRYHSILR